ncbi:KAP family P-loop NTPase fold protein [Kocuria turfanensis]|uniref:KAP NTPase domain-containing protein n=1 Tax=Kocuria turfanensis TaxID=388357 RepID=A0A512IGQ6_9MICC|nr:P-loop NTPase fold protein [Kocuria turfanensis]GEO96896.1 hypothetical protein KTU01_30190 [Kocuria turfanensis]
MKAPSDNPINEKNEDLLSRADTAAQFARQVLKHDASQGLVVGVLGPWGSGKTSFLNLARPQLEKAGAALLDFNPWMFSGADQLVDSFFVELAAQLKLKAGLPAIGKLVEEYGEVFSGLGWVPVVGTWFERSKVATTLVGRLMQWREEGVEQRQDRLRKALLELEKPIIVFLDDIDRLSSVEIRDVFKLVRLTASFPNVTYIVAFDRTRVEYALSEENLRGRDYLEKILQLAVDLPAVPPELLRKRTIAALDEQLPEAAWIDSADNNRWPDVYMEIISPLIKNMRDVRRYVASMGGAMETLAGKVALSDILGLEAIRIFLPDVYSHLHLSAQALTALPSDWPKGQDSPEYVAYVEELIRRGGEHGSVVAAVIKQMFPAAQRHLGGSAYVRGSEKEWLRTRRVAHEDILRLYLEKVAGASLTAFDQAQRAWAVMDDLRGISSVLNAVDPQQLPDVVSHLEVYEDAFGDNHVVSGVVALANQFEKLPDRDIGVFDIPDELIVSRLMYLILRKVEDEQRLADMVREILVYVPSLNGQRHVLDIVGYRENAGHRLISQDAAASFERAWRAEVRSRSATNLSMERELLRVVVDAQRSNSDEPNWRPPEDPDLTVSILQSAVSRARSQELGKRAIQYEDRLAWDSLVKAFGSQLDLIWHVELAREVRGQQHAELFELVDKYLGGWRTAD